MKRIAPPRCSVRFLACVAAGALLACSGSSTAPDGDDFADALDIDEADGGGEDAAEIGDGDAADAADEGTDAGPTPCELAGAARVETVAMLAVGRYAPVAAALTDGRALVAGGYDFSRGIQRSAEIFDPASDTLSPTGGLCQARNFPATVTLPDGPVLVFGGFHTTFGSTGNTEIFDPAAGTFAYAPDTMEVGREAHTATLLPDGRVLVAGGLQAIGFEFHFSTELYDPATETFAPAAPMYAKRAFHAAVLLASGESVLVVGGDSGDGELASAERYVIATDEFWTVGGLLPHAAKAVAAASLPDGTVLVAGGANAMDGTLADTAIYVPAADHFVPMERMATRRMAHTLTRLADGRVLAVGGWSDSSTPSASTGVLEVFDPATGSWTTLPVELARPRHDHAALLLADCRVLVVGGQSVVGGGAAQAPVEVEVVTVPLAY